MAWARRSATWRSRAEHSDRHFARYEPLAAILSWAESVCQRSKIVEAIRDRDISRQREGLVMKMLMILTSHDMLGNTGRKTGFWLKELAAPYFVFRGGFQNWRARRFATRKMQAACSSDWV